MSSLAHDAVPYGLILFADMINAAMNSQMRRIDLVCKLLGPFLIAMIDGISTEVAILVNFGINVASISIEYLFIAQVLLILHLASRPKSTYAENL